MVVYEDNRTYGAGAEIASMISEACLFVSTPPSSASVAARMSPMPFATTLEHAFLASDHWIWEHMRELARF